MLREIYPLLSTRVSDYQHTKIDSFHSGVGIHFVAGSTATIRTILGYSISRLFYTIVGLHNSHHNQPSVVICPTSGIYAHLSVRWIESSRSDIPCRLDLLQATTHNLGLMLAHYLRC